MVTVLHAPVSGCVQTTERYLGCKQKLRHAVNDNLGIGIYLCVGAASANRTSGALTSGYAVIQDLTTS